MHFNQNYLSHGLNLIFNKIQEVNFILIYTLHYIYILCVGSINNNIDCFLSWKRNGKLVFRDLRASAEFSQ